MKSIVYLACLMICSAGCGVATHMDSEPAAAPSFELTDAAAAKVRDVMASQPGCTHVIVSVDFDDEKYCTGVHYNLGVGTNPDEARYARCESKGLLLAIERDDLEFLRGTTLDFYASSSSGIQGFVFHNPQDRESLPDGLLR